MNISTTWLREWANPEVSDAILAQRLTMTGLEVDGIEPVAPPFENIIVAKVITQARHPNADKLSLCQVEVGADNPLQIICGASNIRADLKVVVALIGAKLPSGLKIKKAKLRGVESFGMICSEAELGIADISDNTDGIMELSDDALIGQNIRTHLNLDDNIIALDITPNRADCFSVLGVARELCANFDLTLPIPNYQAKATIKNTVKTNVENPSACPKYLTRVIKNIDNTRKTPEWMAQKLRRAGQNTHSPVVDVTNFVLLELGQPMHAFDLAKIQGNIEVRMAQAGEQIALLNEQTATLKNNTLVIADEKSVLAIAGVMGGALSSTQILSSDILLESAFFDPTLLAGTARQYGLHTESSLRFERGVDFNITQLAMERATELILEICGGQAGAISQNIDAQSLPKLKPITITRAKIQKILGFELAPSWIEQKFLSLEFEISHKDADSWTIIPPSFRFDIRIPADLIEELARLYGYDKLPVQKLSLDTAIQPVSETCLSTYNIAQSLVSRGYQEVITYSFIAEEYHDLITPDAPKIKLSNPISQDMALMRASLWVGLLQSAMANQRRGYENVRFFETGLCFEGTQPSQQIAKIAGVVSGNRFADQWSAAARALDFFDAKADVEMLLALSGNVATFEACEHPALQTGQSAKISLATRAIGWIGALSPVLQDKLSLPNCYLFELDLSSVQQGSLAKYQPFSVYQQSKRDIAFVVDDAISVGDILTQIRALGQVELIEVRLFDVYIGEHIAAGKKSVALNLVYQSLKSTLSDAQVNTLVAQVLSLMSDKFAAVQR